MVVSWLVTPSLSRSGGIVAAVAHLCFGHLTREKQIETVARAVARARAALPDLWLMLVGPSPEPGRLGALGAAVGGAGGVADESVTQLLRQGAAKVFKKYSQMKLQMKREALQKLNRKATEGRTGFDTEKVH